MTQYPRYRNVSIWIIRPFNWLLTSTLWDASETMNLKKDVRNFTIKIQNKTKSKGKLVPLPNFFSLHFDDCFKRQLQMQIERRFSGFFNSFWWPLVLRSKEHCKHQVVKWWQDTYEIIPASDEFEFSNLKFSTTKAWNKH